MRQQYYYNIVYYKPTKSCVSTRSMTPKRGTEWGREKENEEEEAQTETELALEPAFNMNAAFSVKTSVPVHILT